MLWVFIGCKRKEGKLAPRDHLCYRRSLYLVLYPPHLNMPTAVDDTEKSDSNSKCILIIATVAKKGSIVFFFAKAFPIILALAHKHLPDHADRGLLIPSVHEVTSRTLDEFEEALHHAFVHEFDGINYEVAVERGAVPSAAFFRGVFAFCHETVYRCRLAMREEQRAWLEVLGDDKVPRHLRELDSDVVRVWESRTTRYLELVFFHDLEQVVFDCDRKLRVVVDLKQKVVAKSPRQVELDCQAPMSHDAVLL